MAKTKKNQSAKIREYIKAHPKASAGEIAKSLKVRTNLVYNVKSKLNGKSTASAKKSATRKVSDGSNGAVVPSAADGTLIQAAALLKNCGSVEEATRAIQTVARVADALSV